MADIKQAVRSAYQFVRDIFAEHEQPEDIRLEEVKRTEDDSTWHVTLSFLRQLPAEAGAENAPPLIGMLTRGPQAINLNGKWYQRVYKEVAVDRQSGEVKSMEIRVLN